jgi:hypothetical protein
VQIPSVYAGGKIVVTDDQGCVVCDLAQEICAVKLDAEGKLQIPKSAFSYYYACFFEGKRVEEEEITSGSRIFLVYDLLWNESEVSVPLSANSLKESAIQVTKKAFADWDIKQKMRILPFENRYSDFISEDDDNYDASSISDRDS